VVNSGCSNDGDSAGSSRVADLDSGKMAELNIIFDVYKDTHQGDPLCGGM